MNQSNPYLRHGYEHHAPEPQPQEPSRKRGALEKVFGQKIASRLRSPLVATAVLLVVGASFAAIIVSSYPASEEQSVPVVKAETTAFKEQPDTPGGMDIPNRDSTVFMVMRDGEMQEVPQIENLLADAEEEKPVDKLEAFAKEAEDIMDRKESATEKVQPKETRTARIIQKVENIPPEDMMKTAEKTPERPEKLHAPGSSPETLAFVRSVLDNKDSRTATAAQAPVSNVTPESLAAVEPSAGSATAARSAVSAPVPTGGYYVQLGSVTSLSGAKDEWVKLQKKFPTDLGGVSHRVQEANLGERGTYFRIQAGPFNKGDATAMCDSIKIQKPSGCLVVK